MPCFFLILVFDLGTCFHEFLCFITPVLSLLYVFIYRLQWPDLEKFAKKETRTTRTRRRAGIVTTMSAVQVEAVAVATWNS